MRSKLILEHVDYMEPWMLPMTRLPSRLEQIHFRIYRVLFDWYESERGEESLEHLRELVERAAQCAPNALISITSTTQESMHPKCQATADAIIERLREERRSKPGSFAGLSTSKIINGD